MLAGTIATPTPAAASRAAASTCAVLTASRGTNPAAAQIVTTMPCRPVRDGKQDPAVVPERIEADGIGRGERAVPPADDDDERLVAEEDRRAEPAGTRLGPDGDVCDAGIERVLEDIAVVELVEPHRHARMGFAHALDRRRQQADREREDGRDLDLGELEGECRAPRAIRPLCGQQGAARLRQEGPAGGRKPRSARQALEQRAAHLELEQPDLLRDRRRSDVQVVGRGTERPALGDRDQVLELPEIHGALEQ